MFGSRKPNELFRPECVGLRGGASVSVMFQGCIINSGVGTLVGVTETMNSDKYLQTLVDNLWPIIAKNFPKSDYIYRDDNAPRHKSYKVMAWIRANAVPCFKWPSQSPDINI